MSSNLNYKQIANVKRRTWDVEKYEQKAKARAEAQAAAAASSTGPPFKRKHQQDATADEQQPAKRTLITDEAAEELKEEFAPADPGSAGPMGSERAFLKPRTRKVDSIDSRVGTTELISAEAAARTKLGDKDDDGIDAVTSKDNGVTKTGVGWHCRVCDCFLKDSMTYLDHINGRKHQRKLGYSMRVERSTKDQMMSRLSQLAKEKERANEKKDEQLEETNFHVVVKSKDEDEARRKAEKAKRRQEKKQHKREQQPEHDNNDDGEDEEEEPQMDPALAAMMGFSGFGGDKKNG